MNREELVAAITGLAALVQHEAACMAGDVAQYGRLQWDPNTPAVQALTNRLYEMEAFRIPPHREAQP